MAKSAIMGTADTDVRDNDRVSQAGPFAMGAGMVDPGKVARPGSAFNPGLVYDAGFFEYLGFLCDEGPEAFVNPAATCAGLAAGGVPTTSQNLNYPSIGIAELAGVETVTRTVTSVATGPVTFTPSINAPAGYDVSVTPDSITLAPGESASYEVTFTNVAAVLGEWAFGDLTWSGSGYDVRSPIALKAVQLSAPAEVTGTGVAGQASFDVKFGYTGAYTALPHGLVPATATDSVVFQDPDQAPFTADDGNGLILLPFTVTGAALARWSLVIPGADDLDLYLIGPDGETIVAQSTAGGTDEHIELAGTGRRYLHPGRTRMGGGRVAGSAVLRAELDRAVGTGGAASLSTRHQPQPSPVESEQ